MQYSLFCMAFINVVVYTIMPLCPIVYIVYDKMIFKRQYNARISLLLNKILLFIDSTNLRHIRASWFPDSCQPDPKLQLRHALLLLLAAGKLRLGMLTSSRHRPSIGLIPGLHGPVNQIQLLTNRALCLLDLNILDWWHKCAVLKIPYNNKDCKMCGSNSSPSR